MISEKFTNFVTKPAVTLTASVALGGGGLFLVHEAFTSDTLDSPEYRYCEKIVPPHQRGDCLDEVFDQAHKDTQLKEYAGIGCLALSFALTVGTLFGALDEASWGYQESNTANQ